MPGNPIALRLELLATQWATFTSNDQARLLRWLCLPDEVPMVETFLLRESEADGCVTPDVFARFDDAFVHPATHGYTLRKTFLAALEEAGLAATFTPPAARDGDDIGALVALLHAYLEHLEDVEHVVAVLTPEVVKDARAYQAWLQRLVHACPERVRVVVIEDAVAPWCEALAKTEPTRVQSVPCKLTMQSAFEAIAANADDGSPGARFRELFVRLGGKAKEGDLASAALLAGTATDLALTMQCPHLAAGVQMLLAGVHASADKPLEALSCYAEVERLGQATCAIGDSAAPPALAPELGGDVAKVYEEAASLSRALQEPLAELDGLRLASFCHEQQGRRDDAWRCGLAGLEVGAAMNEETLRGSTLGYLGDAMLRQTHAATHSAFRGAIQQHMEKLLGPSWRERLREAAAP